MAIIKYKGTDGEFKPLNNVLIKGIEVVQTTGTSTIEVMSQKAVTEIASGMNETLTTHTANTDAHLTSTEKRDIDSLATNIATISGITSEDITNWNGKQDASGMTAYTTTATTDGLSGTVTAHTANTDMHLTQAEKANIDLLANSIEAVSGISPSDISSWNDASTNSHTHSNKETLDDITASSTAINSLTGSVGSMAFQNTSSYSSATEVETALGGKSNTGHTHDDRYYTESELTGSSTTVVVAKASSATTAASAGSVALANVSDADDLKAIEELSGTSGLLKKTAANTWSLDTTSYSSATQVNTALSGKSNTGHTHTSNEITAMTNYTSGSTNTPISASDSLNTAIGKLEHALGGVKIVTITQAAYDALVDGDTVDATTLYVITD